MCELLPPPSPRPPPPPPPPPPPLSQPPHYHHHSLFLFSMLPSILTLNVDLILELMVGGLLNY